MIVHYDQLIACPTSSSPAGRLFPPSAHAVSLRGAQRRSTRCKTRSPDGDLNLPPAHVH